jgi:hypothetical protein
MTFLQWNSSGLAAYGQPAVTLVILPRHLEGQAKSRIVSHIAERTLFLERGF